MVSFSISMYSVYLLTLFLLGGTFASKGTPWSYKGHDGPDHWADLDGKNSECREKNQSPIDIKTRHVEYKTQLSNFNLQGYDAAQGRLVLTNNGHTAQVDTLNGAWTVSGGSLTHSYTLLQFHFHWGPNSYIGSEHTINSRQYPLEMHMVHMSSNHASVGTAIDDDMGLTVLGVMFEIGPENMAFKEITDQLRNVVNSGQKVTMRTFALRSLLPSDLSAYYTYDGSLTTPPCAEAVVWNIFRQTVKISESQMQAFRGLQMNANDVKNYRPVQPMNGRRVHKSFISEASVVKPYVTFLLLASLLGSMAQVV